jgi:3-methyladenine DNA glycosylase AlkD
MLRLIKKDLRAKSNPKKAKILSTFFKTGVGQYGYGDQFIGVPLPALRALSKTYQDLNLNDIKKLHASKIHEERMLALLILMHQYRLLNYSEKKKRFNFYIQRTRYINNWDLVDVSAPHIVGHFLNGRNRKVLYRMARSNDLWKKRIAIVSTFYFIRQNDFKETLEICKILMKDQHDLIHKATGWMLREVGKRDEKTLERFLNRYATVMPRTSLRYAIERLSVKKRKFYLEMKRV